MLPSRVLAAFAVVAIALTAFAPRVSAQWQWKKNFGSKITVVWLWQKSGDASRPQQGFLGTEAGQVWKTTDGSNTWTQSTATDLKKPVRSFAMIDAVTGYLATGADGFPDAGLWKTTDGGDTWFDYGTASSVFGKGNAVYYNAASDLLFLSHEQDPMRRSTDKGLSWATPALPPQKGGFAFLSDSVGIVGGMGSSILVTSDKGVTWGGAPGFSAEDVWQPLAIPCQGLFYAVGATTGNVWRSEDSGRSWTKAGVLPVKANSGTIAGDKYTLVVQGLTSVWLSTNEGKNWSDLGGPAAGSSEVRFYAGWGVVLAGDGSGDLWMLDLPQDHVTHRIGMIRPVITLTPGACPGAAGSLQVLGAADCQPIVITGITSPDAQFTTSLKTSSGQAVPPLPYTLNNPLRLDIFYTPSTPSNGSVQITIQYTLQGAIGPPMIFDTVVLAGAINASAQPVHLSVEGRRTRRLDAHVARSCMDTLRTMTFFNQGCEPLTITQFDIPDPTHFTLVGINTPVQIPARDSVRLPVLMSSREAGTFTTDMRVAFNNTLVSRDTFITLTYVVDNGTPPVLTAKKITVPDPCVTADSSIWIKNTGCENLVITSAALTGAGSDFLLALGKLPITIAPGDSVRIPFQVKAQTPKTITGTLRLNMNISGVAYDQLFPIDFTLAGSIGPRAEITPKPDFGNVSLCREADLTLIFRNPVCRPLTIKNVVFTPNGGITLTSQPTTPKTYQPGGVDTFRFHYKPTASGTFKANMTLKLEMDGSPKDEVVLVSGTGVSATNVALTEHALAFGTMLACDEPKELSTWLVNHGCDSVEISDLLGLHNEGYEVVEPTLPAWIHVDDSIRVVVRLKPRASGDAIDSLEIRARDKSGAERSEMLAFTGFVETPVRSIALSAQRILLDTINPCVTAQRDTSFRVKNNGVCDSLVITSITSDIPELTFTSPVQVPFVIRVGEEKEFGLRMTGSNEGDLVAKVRLQGPGFDTTIEIKVSVKRAGGKGVEAQSASNIFNVRGCETETIPITVTNDGCTAVAIDSVVIVSEAGQTQFRLLGLPTFPATVNPGTPLGFELMFSGEGTGNGQATVLVYSNGVAKPLVFSGQVQGKGAATVELQPMDGTNVTRAAGSPFAAKLAINDAVTADRGLTSIRTILLFNDDLLRLNASGSNGWTVTRNKIDRDHTELVFTRTGAATVPAGGADLAALTFDPAVTDRFTTSVDLTVADFNPSDPDYARCTLTPTALSSTISFTLDPQCSDSILSDHLSKKPLIEVFSIRPNPAGLSGRGQGIEVEYRLGLEAEASVTIYDQRGSAISTSRYPASVAGQVRLADQGLAEGVYYVELRVEGQSRIEKLLVRR